MGKKKELVVTAVTLLIMWLGYYADNRIFSDNMIFTLFGSMLGIVIGLCVVFPLYWVTRVTKEGIQGLGITREKLPVSILMGIILCTWRFLEIKSFIGSESFWPTLLFNAFSIWEVLFIFGWLFTRYKRAFGNLPAILLTSLSVGVYHIGTLELERIVSLCVVIVVCGVFYSITENIFTLWPVYWAVGCSASTLGSGMEFPMEMVCISGITLVIQIVIIIGFVFFGKRKQRGRGI